MAHFINFIFGVYYIFQLPPDLQFIKCRNFRLGLNEKPHALCYFSSGNAPKFQLRIYKFPANRTFLICEFWRQTLEPFQRENFRWAKNRKRQAVSCSRSWPVQGAIQCCGAIQSWQGNVLWNDDLRQARAHGGSLHSRRQRLSGKFRAFDFRVPRKETRVFNQETRYTIAEGKQLSVFDDKRRSVFLRKLWHFMICNEFH